MNPIIKDFTPLKNTFLDRKEDDKKIPILFAGAFAGAALLSRGKISPTLHYAAIKMPKFPYALSKKSSFKASLLYNFTSVKTVAGLAFLLPFSNERAEMESSDVALSTLAKDHPLREQVTSRVVGHEADFLIAGTSLEGEEFHKNVNHLHTFVKYLSDQEKLSSQTTKSLHTFFNNIQIVPAQQSSKERLALAKIIAEKVFSLKERESVFMEGGWSDKNENGSFDGGHALIYKFTKKNGLYDVYVYNTGSGVEKYHACLEVEEGIKKHTLFCPYVKFQGVTPEELGFYEKAHPEFFERLIHIKQGL